jgi:hypothetical protein
MRLCTSSCKTSCPTNDASPCRNVRHNDRRLDACRLAAVSSYLAQQFDGVSLRSGIRCGEAAVWLFAAIDLLLRAMFRGRCAFRPDRQKSWLGARPKGNMVRNPDALGLSTRLGAERSRGSAHARHGQSHRRRLYGPARRFSDSMVAQTVGRAHDEQAYAHA